MTTRRPDDQSRSRVTFLARSLVIIAVAAPLLAVGPTAQASVLMSEPSQNSPSQGTHTAVAAEKSYSLATVRKHRTATDCWSAVNGGVYNLTQWIGKHPGGSSAILSLCGKNGSAAFNGQHGGSAKVAAVLKPYRIGRLR
jgi:cytochrome b involved in lipid metabolism